MIKRRYNPNTFLDLVVFVFVPVFFSEERDQYYKYQNALQIKDFVDFSYSSSYLTN